MSQLKSVKDLKHKVVVIFYQDENDLKDLGEDLDVCLPDTVDFAILDHMDDLSELGKEDMMFDRFFKTLDK